MGMRASARSALTRAFIVALGIVGTVGVLVYKRGDEAHDRAKLECRLSGGNYEYFGTQGYHCIGGKK